eukprot:5515347-Pleurochrysis_carterae.AAC.1
MRGSNTGVGVSVGRKGLSASLPPVAFAGGLSPEASAVRAQRRRAGGRLRHQRSLGRAPLPCAVRVTRVVLGVGV